MHNTHIDYTSRNFWSALRRLSAQEQQQFILEAYQNGWISDWQLWDVLSSERSPIAYAAARVIYIASGHLPFSGYPLTPIKED